MPSQSSTRRFLLYTVAILAGMLVLALAVWPRLVAAANPDPVTAAWEKARAAGSYHFDSDVTQVTIPSPKVANVGRTSRTQSLHLTGQTDLRQHSLEMQLWSEGGSILQNESGLAVKMTDGKSYVRRQDATGSSAWQEVESGIDGFAPQGDFLAYLAAVRDVQTQAPETRTLLNQTIRFTRYTFTLDGPTFAAFMRGQMEQALRAKGELPPGMQLQTADYYRQMRGDGELWVREDGLPLRQILNLTFPEQQDEFVSAQITVDFSRFGRPEVSLADLARAGNVAGLVAALSPVLPDLTPVLMSIFLLVTATLILYHRRTRTVQAAVATAVITSLVIAPILSTFKADAFFAAQTAKAAAQDQQRAESDMQRSLRSLGDRPEFNPQANPLETGRQGDWEIGVQSPNLSISQSPNLQTTDNGADNDNDGLSDFVEARVATNPAAGDTEGDGLLDALEVHGFDYAGKRWYTDPQALDSNDDGIPDETEWGRNADGTRRATPLDTDNDGIPDLFDPDNDNDGVPDRQDLSPFTQAVNTLSEATPLNLTISNLTANQPTFVDFQLRPTNEKHLWFAFNVLDWPRNDNQGQVMDVDGNTYADQADAAGRTADANESGGDMKLIPMLEIRMPANGANLPLESDLTPYGIIVNNLTEDGSQQVAYVPLSLVVDEQTGQRVAFSGRMSYLPTGSLPGQGWPAAHQVRLAWVVQALVDLACDKATDTSADCQADGYLNNVPQVVQNYYDDWTLTGLNISEQHGATTAIIYEDPASGVDPDRHDDAALFTLTHALDETFLAARDQNGDGQRDVDITAITNNLSTLVTNWEIPNILQAESFNYPTFDQTAMYTAMTDTVSLLDSVFSPVWSTDHTLMPTLLYAYEQASRSLSLDAVGLGGSYVNLNLNNLSVDFQPLNQSTVEPMTVAGLKWTHYCRSETSTAWAVCPPEDYWEVLRQRYGNTTLPGDPNDPDVQAGRVAVTQLYDLTLGHGVNNIVQRGNTLLSAPYSLKDDPTIAGTVRGSLALGRIAVVFLVNQAAWAAYFRTSVVAQLGKWATEIGQRFQGNVDDFAHWVVAGEFRSGVLILGLKLLVGVGVATAAIIAASGHGNQDTRIALRAIMLGLQIFLALIDPLLTFARIAKAGITLAYSSEFITVSRGSLVIGTVIGIAIVWGFFIYSMAANNVTPFSPEFNRALAETIAATIYLILLALISLTIVGLLLVGIVAVIDAILTAICELGVDDLRDVPGLGGACFTLGTTAIKAIAYALYNYDVMIDTDRRDMVSPGSSETRLADATKGFVVGNPISITMPITTNISHKSPDPANGLMINSYLYFFSTSNLRSTTFNYSLSQPDKQDLSAGLNTMSGAWQNVREHHKYAATPMYGGYAVITPTHVTNINLPAGINQTPAFYLNMGYALPAYECWYIPLIGIYGPPVCYTRTFTGNSSTQIETLRYDIFPATFADFVSIAAKPDSGFGLSWDSRFPSLADADGDGLRANAHGGIDPNDNPNAFAWDTDRDGLSDGNEMERRAAGFAYSPIQCDTDGDGLADAQEAHFGTNPSNRDTDNDGLNDATEVWHQFYNTTTCQPTPAWVGGWDVTINAATPFTIRATANPRVADSDGDGIDDLAERQLAQHADPTKRLDDENRPYHPGVFNSSPIKLYPATDKQYVRPGGSVVYTNTVVSKVEIVPSVLDVTLPSAFGSSPAPARLNFDPLTFSGSQTVTHQMVLTAQGGLPTQMVPITSSVRARLMDTGTATLAWDALTPQTLGSTAQPVRFSAAAAPLIDRQDSFLVSALLSDSASRGGSGVVQTHAIPGGQSGQLVNDSAGLTQRGASAADIACIDAGACMVVWDQHERCNTLTINYLQVATSGESGGIEPVIYWIADYNDTNPADGGYELKWNPLTNGGRDMSSGEQRGPNANGFPLPSITVCGDGRIDIYEADSETVTNDPSNMDLIGSSLRFPPDNFNLDPNLTVRFTRSGITSEVDLNVSMPRKNLDTVKGALLDPTGQIVRGPFDIPAAFATSQRRSHNFRPVVASDGYGFLVASELAAEPDDTYLQWQRFDATGIPIEAARTSLLEDQRGAALTDSSVALDAVGVGIGYRLGRKFIRAHNDPAQTIYLTDDFGSVPAGTETWTIATTEAAPDERGAPVLAHNPRADQTLLLYKHANSEARRILYPGSSLTPVLGDARLGLGENTGFSITPQDPPHAVYNPMANAWLISWTTPPGLGLGIVYSLWQPNLSGRIISDQKLSMNSSSNFNSRSQACPVIASQPVTDLRFEELPDTNTFTKHFIDSSGRGYNATCEGAACPAAAVAGAVDNLGNAAGTPASDYAVRFDGVDDTITLQNPYQATGRNNFTIAFWYKAGATTQQNAPFTIAGVDVNHFTPVRLQIHNTTGRIEFSSGGKTIAADANLNDGRWHSVVAVSAEYPFSIGRISLYLDGNSTPIATDTRGAGGMPNTFRISGGGTAVSLDQFQIYIPPLSPNTVRDLYTRSLQSYCIGANYDLGQYRWLKLNVSTPDVRGGKLTASAGMTITIDGDAPTSTIGGLSNSQYILGNTIHTIGGNANDATSGVTGVEVSVNGAAFQPANGAETWVYNLSVTEGSYTIQSRATDVAGNVESPGSGITVIADATPPNVTLNALPATPSVPTRNAAGQWSISLGGTASDPNSGGQPGSGVQAGSVEVKLVGQAGNDDAQGNGWQQATLNGNTWSIDYRFADALADPTGVYTVSVRATDQIGNHTADNAATGTLRLDGAAPLATLNTADAVRSIITDTVTIGGVITDTGPAGVQQVEISFVTLEQVAALPVDVSNDQAQTLLDAAGRTWLPATLTQAGAGVTTWSAQVPAGLEGEYQIDLRASDTLNHRRTSPNVWRGIIDTQAPRLVMAATPTNATYFDEAANLQRYEFIYTCSAADRYLVEQDFVCDGTAIQPSERFFTQDASVQALFPDRTILSTLAITYSLWEESAQPSATVSACDAFGHCATESNQLASSQLAVNSETVVAAAAPAPGAPQAVIIAPGHLRYVAASGALPVTVAAEAGQGLKEVTLALDGVDVNTFSFTQGEMVTRTQRTLSIAVAGVGSHTLTARATDWTGAMQSQLYPITFQLDAQPPALTLDTNELTAAATWQVGSGILRFHGTASDDVGLAAVKVQVDGQPFVNATFGNGTWSTALPVVDPEGRSLLVTVRALDFAGQVTQVSHTIPTNLSAADAPDTTIADKPANPSDANMATFTFAGIPGGREVVAFACKLDEEPFIPCTSPWQLNDLSKGEHTFRVRAIDEAGYADLSPAAFTWTINASALDATITGSPANPTSSREATFAFIFTGTGTSFECALDEAAFAHCSSGKHYSGLSDGRHTFQVRASDGVATGTAARFSWMVVNAAPVASDQAVTTNQDVDAAITLAAADSDDLNYTVVNPPAHGVLLDVAPDLTYSPDSGFFGTDSFTFRASDGQADSNIATVNITVAEAADSTLLVITPQVNGTGGSNGWYVGDVTLTWSVVDNESPVTSQVGCDPATLNSETAGTTFTCTATSKGGTASQSITIKLDKTTPETTLTVQPPDPSNSATVTFQFSGADATSGVANLTCALDGAGFAPCTSPKTYTALPAGSHTFQVQATNHAGHVDATPASYTWTAPALTLLAACGPINAYRDPQGKLVAPGWYGTIKLGTSGNNTINGGNGADLMLGLGGNDKLDGKGGDDLLCGGDGVDQLLGAAGKDYLDGGTGNDVLNGGAGDHDTLLAGEGNDTLLDGDGVLSAQGGPGNDTFTLALRNGWRDTSGQARFSGLAAGYGNDAVALAVLGSTRFYLDITGDERDNPPSPLEGMNDSLVLAGQIDATSLILKFERRTGVTAASAEASLAEQGFDLDRGAHWATLTDESGAEFLTEPVGGDEPVEEGGSVEEGTSSYLFLPLVAR